MNFLSETCSRCVYDIIIAVFQMQWTTGLKQGPIRESKELESERQSHSGSTPVSEMHIHLQPVTTAPRKPYPAAVWLAMPHLVTRAVCKSAITSSV